MPTDPKTAPAWVRSKVIQVRLTPGEHADLQVLASEWGVNGATQAAWGIIEDYLARCRKRRGVDLPFGNAEVSVLAHAARERIGGEEQPEDEGAEERESKANPRAPWMEP